MSESVFQEFARMLILPVLLIVVFVVLCLSRPWVLKRHWPYLAAAGASILAFVIGWFLPIDMVMSNDHGMLITTRGWLRILLPANGILGGFMTIILWGVADGPSRRRKRPHTTRNQ